MQKIIFSALILAAAAFAAALWFRPAPALAAEEPAAGDGSVTPATVKLLADHAVITPGQTFHIGVLYELKPHWHIYWKNPGSSGIAPTIELKLPEGFKAQPIRWPIPRSFKVDENTINYGYEDKVLLTIPVTAAKDLPDGPIQISAKLTWLACKIKCVMGDAAPTIKLASGDKPQPANAELFKAAAGQLPQSSDQAGKPDGLLKYFKASSKPAEEGFTDYFLFMATDPPLTDLELFPPADGALVVDELKAGPTREKGDGPTREVGGVAVTFGLKVAKGLKPAADRGSVLLVGKDAAGKRRGVELFFKLPN